MSDNHFKYSNSVLALPLFFVWFLWFVYWLEIRFGFDFNKMEFILEHFRGYKAFFLVHLSMPTLIICIIIQFLY